MSSTAEFQPRVSAYQAALVFSDRRRILVLIVVALAFVMDLLDTTIVNVAIPSIQSNLSASNAVIQWSLAGYTLAFSILLVSGGRLGDVYGYRRLFLSGVAGFTLASMMCGLAWSAPVLVAARLLQGAGAALMVPQVMALMQVLYLPERRVRVFAIFGILGGVSGALGPIIGGLLIKANWFDLDWRLVFFINLPVGVFSFVAGALLLPKGRGIERIKLDLAGTVLSILWLTSIVMPLIEGPALKWTTWTWLTLLSSLPLGWLTWRYMDWRTRRDGSALVNPQLLRLRTLRLGLMCSLCVHPVIPGYLLMLTLILQQGWGYSALDMSLICLPIALGAMFSISLLSQRLVPYLGPRTISLGIVVTGISLVTVGVALQSAPQSQALLALGQLGMGLGLGLSGPPLSMLTLQDAPLRDAGAASGLAIAVQQIAGALGIAGTGLMFFMVLTWVTPISGSGLQTPAQAVAYLRVLPLLLGLLAVGLFISLRLPAFRHQAARQSIAH